MKEVGTQNDLNNSHMLAVIEKKMCAEDVKVWSREIEQAGGVATLEGLLKWMSVPVKHQWERENKAQMLALQKFRSLAGPMHKVCSIDV